MCVHEIRQVQPEDVPHIFLNIDDASRVAIEACGIPATASFGEALVHQSFSAQTITKEGIPIALFGVIRTPQSTGSVWLVAVNNLPRLPASLIRLNRDYILQMLGEFGTLQTVVWEHNKSHIRWVKWIGFKEAERLPYGTGGEIFYKFILEQQTWV